MKILIDKEKLEEELNKLGQHTSYDEWEQGRKTGKIEILESILQQGEEYNEKYPDLPKDYKEITGWNNPDEQAAYDLGREHEQKVILNFIKNWKGDTNSVFGQLMKEKCEEYNENEAIEFADFCGKNSMDYNSTLNQWKYHKENISWKSTQELFKLYKNEGKHK